MRDQADEIAASLTAATRDRDAIATVLRDVAESFLDYRTLATGEAEQLAEFAGGSAHVVQVPVLETGVGSLADVLAVGEFLW